MLGGIKNGHHIKSAAIHIDLYPICLSKRNRWELVSKLNENEVIQDVWMRMNTKDILTDGKQIFLIDYQNRIAIFDPTNNQLTSNIEIPREMRGGFASATVGQ